MLIADIKSQTKGVHFSQKLQDAHENSFQIIVRQGRHPMTQLLNIKNRIVKKLSSIRIKFKRLGFRKKKPPKEEEEEVNKK